MSINYEKPSGKNLIGLDIETSNNLIAQVIDLQQRPAQIQLAQTTDCGWRACYNRLPPVFRDNPDLRGRGGFAPRLEDLPPPERQDRQERWRPNPSNLRNWQDRSDYCRVPKEFWKDPQNYDYLCGRRR